MVFGFSLFAIWYGWLELLLFNKKEKTLLIFLMIYSWGGLESLVLLLKVYCLFVINTITTKHIKPAEIFWRKKNNLRFNSDCVTLAMKRPVGVGGGFTEGVCWFVIKAFSFCFFYVFNLVITNIQMSGFLLCLWLFPVTLPNISTVWVWSLLTLSLIWHT